MTLEQVYGALAFYLSRRSEIDDYLAASRAEFGQLRAESRWRNPGLYAKIEAARGTSVGPRFG